MRIIKQITTNKFLNIKEVYDSEKHCKGYQFAERRGQGSVAFICYDKTTGKFLLNKEYTPPTDEFLVRAFGGSLDKDKPLIDIVREEVKEEVGYEVSNDMIRYLGSLFVSTQMNQYCHLFLVDITSAKQTGREPENKIEAMAETLWKDDFEIVDGSDWKAITILSKAKQKKIIG